MSFPGLLINRDVSSILLSSLWRRNPPTFRESNNHKEFIKTSLQNTKDRIRLAVNWIQQEQSMQPDGGVTAWILIHSFYMRSGSYPEVTGYIIPTVFESARLFNDQDLFISARRMADFELSLQMADGAFPGDVVGAKIIKRSVFNTAQIIHGLVHTYKLTYGGKYLDAAVRAADWIASVQNDDGSWSVCNYMGLKRVYDAKVSEALLELHKITQESTYYNAAMKNLDFVLSNQTETYWFANCDNSRDKNNKPLTHTIGYTLQGLLESGIMLSNSDAINAARHTLDRLLRIFELRKDLLAGRYNKNWKPTVKSSCVTGCAQIAICWQRLFEITGDLNYLNAALKMNDLLKSIQFTKGSRKILGALPASYPIWGNYGPWVVNSWGVKYFIDSLLLEYKAKEHLTGERS